MRGPQVGYGWGTVLVSPDGTRTRRVHLRPLRESGRKDRASRQLARLLSAGWTVMDPGQQQQPGRRYAPKGTSLVLPATSKTSDAAHGGDSASGEVPDSPNRGASTGQQQPKQQPKQETSPPPRQRGGRGGRRKKAAPQNTPRNTPRKKGEPVTQASAGRAGSHHGCQVRALQPLEVNPQVTQSARASAQLLADVVGRLGGRDIRAGVDVDPLDLLVRLETGDDPIPALEVPRVRPRVRVLVTPDSSGSTQSWSGLGRAWANLLAQDEDVDVAYVDNFNGQIQHPSQDQARGQGQQEHDLILYLGDRDGYESCRDWARTGMTVIALDCHCARLEAPVLVEDATTRTGGRLLWVQRVSAKAPQTWAQALRLCQPRVMISSS